LHFKIIPFFNSSPLVFVLVLMWLAVTNNTIYCFNYLFSVLLVVGDCYRCYTYYTNTNNGEKLA
jgi:hypothetical protein